MRNNTKDWKKCQQLCKDIDYLIDRESSSMTHDSHAFREEIIDEYVYLLSNKRIEEIQEYVKNELDY